MRIPLLKDETWFLELLRLEVMSIAPYYHMLMYLDTWVIYGYKKLEITSKIQTYYIFHRSVL